MAQSHELGMRAEHTAARYLEARGWTILERNWRFGHKEIDLVVRRGRTIAFVEVKCRAGPAYGHPLEAITAAKRRDLALAARAWLVRHGRGGDEPRFDAVAVRPGADGGLEVEHVEDAWRL